MLKAELNNIPKLEAKMNGVVVNVQDNEGSYNRGYAEGHVDGYNSGYGEGESVGIEKGYSDGYKVGNEEGLETGYKDGYDTGYAEGLEAGSQDGYEWFNDGNTHIWINLIEEYKSPVLGVRIKGTVNVDWGDGTTPDVLSYTRSEQNQFTSPHNYEKAGKYVITLTVVEGYVRFSGLGNSYDSGAYLLRYSSSQDFRNVAYISSVEQVEIGNGVKDLYQYAFRGFFSLKRILIPEHISAIGNYAFSNCVSLQELSIPEQVTTIGTYAFEYCYSLKYVNLPNNASITTNYAFQNCYNLQKLDVPPTVSRIETNAFLSCHSAMYFDFSKHTAVPTLANQNVFYRINPDCEIRVPLALVDEWKAATNWSTYADQIVGV